MATKQSARDCSEAELPVVLRSHDPNSSIIRTACPNFARVISGTPPQASQSHPTDRSYWT